MRNALAVASVAVVIAYAALSGLWVTNSSSWYLSLQQPPWQPPNWIFGVIWPYNFIMLAWVSVLVMRNADSGNVYLWFGALCVSVATAIGWSYCFYVLQQLGLAASLLVVTAVVTLLLTVISREISLTTFWAFMPYQLWLITAASLAVGYWRLNP
jgi:tryptophan-rich sensory protein